MTRRSPLRIPRPEDLPMPLRDIIRGLQLAARIPMNLSQPVVSSLPGPVRDMLSDIGQRAEMVYSDSLKIWRPKTLEIGQATAWLNRAESSDLAAAGRVLAWATEVALAHQDDAPTVFISETAVTFALRDSQTRCSPDADPAERAADAVFSLGAHGLGPSPHGFPTQTVTPERTSQLRIAAFAAALFLLAERSSDLNDELRILSYAITITELIAADIQGAAEDIAKTAELLRHHAEMI